MRPLLHTHHFTTVALLSLGTVPFAGAEPPTAMGPLTFFISGEDLATAGFTAPQLTKDGWSLAFEHIYVTVTDVTAYQTEPPYQAQVGAALVATATATLPGRHTVELVADADAEDRVMLGSIEANPGHYNALSWRVEPAIEGPAAGWAMVLIGTAEKDGAQVAFRIESAEARNYRCGEYVGDERKGWVSADGDADLELTLHLDHIFGRADKSDDDPMNLDAPGFAPFAEGSAQPSLRGLHIGHVGEGHCYVEWD